MLSIIICTYNRDKYIYNVLQSIAENDFPSEKYEIILVNNNSTDNTENEYIRFKQDYSERMIHYFIEKNQGISFARNRGVFESVGDIIVFIDDDETVDQDFLQNISDFFNIYEYAGISAGPVIPIYEIEKPKWFSYYTEHLVSGAYDKGNVIKLLSKKDYPGTGHACFRKELFLKYGEFNTNLGRKGNSLIGGEDKDFFLRLMNDGILCYYLPTAKIYHHIPASKLTEKYFNELTYSIGKSERMRTLAISKIKYAKRLFSECIKWIASFVLFIGYAVGFSPQKGWKLLVFRKNVTKGLLGK
jgi:glycosyltransferase involved in cell wall biosynthesis